MVVAQTLYLLSSKQPDPKDKNGMPMAGPCKLSLQASLPGYST